MLIQNIIAKIQLVTFMLWKCRYMVSPITLSHNAYLTWYSQNKCFYNIGYAYNQEFFSIMFVILTSDMCNLQNWKLYKMPAIIISFWIVYYMPQTLNLINQCGSNEQIQHIYNIHQIQLNRYQEAKILFWGLTKKDDIPSDEAVP